MTKEYNGHRSWNAWNVSLWINNTEPQYRLAQELSDAKWPFTCIDWEQAAKELSHDYTSIELRPLDENGEECDAITYYYRA